MARHSRKQLKTLYKVTPSKKVVPIEGFETEREAAEAAGGVKCWVVTDWPKRAIYPATRNFSRGEFTYYFTTPDGENHYSRWREADFPTFKEAKAYLLAKLGEELRKDREDLARRIATRNEVRSMRAPKKVK